MLNPGLPLQKSPNSYFGRVGWTVAAVVLTLTALVGGFGWWVADRIDARAISQQLRSINTGISELGDRVAVEQDSSAVWDDSVINLRANNDAWLEENLAEWMSSYFGHDRIYLLDPDDQPIRSVANGERLPNEGYEADRRAIEPLVLELRHQMAAASVGKDDSTEAISGMGVLDRALLSGDQVGIVSVRPVIPGTAQLAQAPGDEYIHVSVRLLDGDVIKRLSDRYDIDQLAFALTQPAASDVVYSPVLNRAGRILGFFTLKPYRPALQLLQDTAPLSVGSGAIAGLIVLALLSRLRRTSAELQVSEQRARYLAFHDPLAAIPNRALFEDRLQQALSNRRKGRAPVALHFIDLDRFKQVNDTLGHPAGDELIREVARRLAAVASAGDTVARIGGDEFAILQIDVDDGDDAMGLGNRVVAELARPFDLSGHQVSIGGSVGVAVTGPDGAVPEDLMRRADVALYEAKSRGRGRCELFAGELDHAVKERRTLELALRGALAGEPGLELAYQPIYDTRSRKLVGAEALVRWNSLAHGRLSPDKFIPLAEERGLIDQLGLWVLSEACTFAAQTSLPWIAVNVSPLQFKNDRFPEQVFSVLGQTGLEARRLELEITEGLLLQNAPSVQEALRRLRASGIRVALDDFGTGYSSISYLRTYGVDKLKIDRSYVGQLGDDRQIDDIVKCIIDLGAAMNMRVTAEGVETERQQIILHRMGCDQLQGYLLSRPVPRERLLAILDNDVAMSSPVLTG